MESKTRDSTNGRRMRADWFSALRPERGGCLALSMLAMAAWAHSAEAASAAEGGSAPIGGEGLEIASDQRSFQWSDGSPFFYLADTAWTAVTRLTPEEMDYYLDDRVAKNFTVIQTIFVPWDAWRGNLAGERPFVDGDERRPNEAYWEYVDLWVDKIAERGLVAAVAPFWLRGRNHDQGPVEDDEERLRAFASFVGERYANHTVIWLLGADAPGDSWVSILGAFSEELDRARNRVLPENEDRRPWLKTHHPEGGGTSARLFHDAEWLDFHGLQSGHTLAISHDHLVEGALRRSPPKPVVDLEAAYEHITNTLRPYAPGVRLVDDWDIRRQAYQALFAGAAGHAYGASEVYEFHVEGRGKAQWVVGVNWQEAMQFQGAGQLQHLRGLMERLPMAGRVPAQSLAGGGIAEDVEQRRRAIRSASGDRVYVYLPRGGTVAYDAETLAKISGGSSPRATWFNPRTGGGSVAGRDQDVGQNISAAWTSPTEGADQDWLLVLQRGQAPR